MVSCILPPAFSSRQAFGKIAPRVTQSGTASFVCRNAQCAATTCWGTPSQSESEWHCIVCLSECAATRNFRCDGLGACSVMALRHWCRSLPSLLQHLPALGTLSQSEAEWQCIICLSECAATRNCLWACLRPWNAPSRPKMCLTIEAVNLNQ